MIHPAAERFSVSPSKGTPVRTIRVPDDLWNAAKNKAASEGNKLGDVLRAMLEDYVSDD